MKKKYLCNLKVLPLFFKLEEMKFEEKKIWQTDSLKIQCSEMKRFLFLELQFD